MNKLLVPVLGLPQPRKEPSMSVTKEEKTVTVEKRSGSSE